MGRLPAKKKTRDPFSAASGVREDPQGKMKAVRESSAKGRAYKVAQINKPVKSPSVLSDLGKAADQTLMEQRALLPEAARALGKRAAKKPDDVLGPMSNPAHRQAVAAQKKETKKRDARMGEARRLQYAARDKTARMSEYGGGDGSTYRDHYSDPKTGKSFSIERPLTETGDPFHDRVRTLYTDESEKNNRAYRYIDAVDLDKKASPPGGALGRVSANAVKKAAKAPPKAKRKGGRK